MSQKLLIAFFLVSCIIAMQSLTTAQNSKQENPSTVFVASVAESMADSLKGLKEQLKESVAAQDLTAGDQFDILAFGGDKVTAPWDGGTQIATPDNKKIANEFIDKLKTNGKSNPIPAMQKAMKMKPRLIYLLLDGLDEKTKPDDLVKAIEKADPDGKVTIDCIYLQPAKKDEGLIAALKTITRKHHGNYKSINKSDL